MPETKDGAVDSGSAILPSSSVILQPFIAKLGHNVEEIRVRALKNILFKLEHKLICVSDLVQERELLIRLLEWFNNTSAPMKKEVLGLLEKLSKHVVAAQVLLSVGAVEFLSQLRQDVDPELFQNIDNVTHLLLSIPQTSGNIHDKCCLYKPHDDEHTDDAKHLLGHHEHCFKASSCQALPIANKPSLAVRSSHSLPQLGTSKGYFEEEKESFSSAYPSTSHVQSSRSTTKSQDSILYSSGSLSFFKWLPLSSSDRHILAVTDSRLQNNSPTLVSKSCEFLSDVLFKDFPAEIFLQRPSVFKSLIGLLEFQSAADGPCVPLCAIECLKELCNHVHARLMATSDPALFCPDQDCWKARQSVFLSKEEKKDASQKGEEYIQERGSGDGGLGSGAGSSASSSTEHHPASSTDDGDEEDELVMEALQYNQLAVEEMCVMLLPNALQVLNGHLSSSQQVLTSTVELLFHVGELIKMVAPDDIWQEGSQSNIVMASSIISSLKLLGEVLVHHMQESGYQGHAVRTEHNLSAHRIAVVNLTVLLVQLLHSLVPIDMKHLRRHVNMYQPQAKNLILKRMTWSEMGKHCAQSKEASHIIPSDTVTVIWLLSMDGILSTTHPHLHASLLEYLSLLDLSSHKTYQNAKRVCQSFQSTCELLKATKSKLSSISVAKQLHLAEDSLFSIAYHRNMDLVKESIQLSRTACLSEASPSSTQTCHSVVHRLLSHYDQTIRAEGYKECLGVVKESLRISHVTHPLSTVCHGILFLLDAGVMYQICCYGLYDEDQEVQTTTIDLLETLLLGRLSMSSKLWKKLLDAITPTLPFLEGFIGTHPTLDQSILELVLPTATNSAQINSDGEVMTLKPLEQLKGALRLLFLQNPNIRTQGLAGVIGHLTSDKTGSWGQRLFRSRQTENLRDLFIVDQLTSTMSSHAPVSHPSVEKAEIIKLWSIYSSKSLDWNIRKSAVEQLAIILQDPEWHSELLELKAEETTLEILKQILETDAETHTPTTPCSSMEIVPPCLKILRLMAEYNWSCRRHLANKTSVFTIVVMCSVVCRTSVQASYEAACLLALLLFDEVAQSSVETGQRNAFSLPCLVKRYHLPFNPPVHKPASDHQLPAPQEPDPLKSDPALSMLRFYWNLAWHESLEKLCAVQGDDGRASPNKQHKYCEALRWTDLDCQILRCSHVQTCVADSLQVLTTAVSHFPAKVALTRILALLMGDLGVASRGAKMVIQKLYAMHWQEALERYLLVLPNSVEDDELLIEVMTLLSCMLTSPTQPPEPVVAWMARITIQSDGPLLSLLRTPAVDAGNVTSQTVTESRRNLRKSILVFYSNLVRCLLQSCKQWRFDGERVLIGELAHAVTLNLDLADNPSYYDLPVLESALECLGHVTACNHWSAYSRSQDAMGLCTSLLQSLVQVVTAFHAGRLGSSTSFMGKGVTYYASLCLVHLVKEMETIDPNKSWISHWIHQDDNDSQALGWLVTLWSDRSPEVRWMGLSIAASLASTMEGHEALIQALQGVAGGVIGITLPIILDDGECGMVRQQATLMLCSIVSNLSSDTALHSGQESGSEDSLSSVAILRALMDHHRFYSRLHTMLTNFSKNVLSHKTTSSRACQSSASVSVSTTSSNIPYRHLQSSSLSVSVTSEAVHNESHSPSPVSNGMRSPGDQGAVTLSNGSVLSSNASVQTPISSLVPLLNERGLPSGMSTGSGSTNTCIASAAGSSTSQSTVVTSSLTPAFVGALAELIQALVTVDSVYTITALKRSNILSVFWSHLDSSELRSFLQVQESPLSSSPSSDSSPSLSCAAVVVVREILHMYTCLVQMTHTLARVDHTLLFDLQQDALTMHRTVGLFAVVVSDLDDKLLVHCKALWSSVSSLLVTLLQSQGPVSVPSITEQTIYKHWTSFTVIFKMVMSRPNQTSMLRSALIKLLCLLLSCEGKRQKQKKKNESSNTSSLQRVNKSQLAELLDDGTQRSTCRAPADGTEIARVAQEAPNEVPLGTGQSGSQCTQRGSSGTVTGGTNMTRVAQVASNKGPPTKASTDERESIQIKNERNSRMRSSKEEEISGGELCSSLLGMFDGMGSKVTDSSKKDKDYIKIAITTLLALSHTAKNYALQDGLVETTLEHIKHLHVQLNMDSLQLGKGPSWKKKDNPVIDEIVSDLDLLGNFIYRSTYVKVTCLECGLIDVLHKLWSWCTVEVSLRSAVLSLLCTLTARCPKASVCIAGGSSTSRASQSGSTLLNSLLKSAASANSRVLGDQTCHDLDVQLATLKTLFNLFSNLVLTGECRGIVWKSNFLHQFSKLKPLKTTQGRPRHVHRAVGVSWLSMLINLTFFTDGQQMVMKVPSCVSILLEFCHVTQGKHVTSDMSLLVLRNLCFHSNSKSVLLSNEALLRHLISNVDHLSCCTRALAVSALWSLAHNNQKAKVTLKNSGLQKKLEELKLKSDKELTQSVDKYQKIYIQAVDILHAHLVS